MSDLKKSNSIIIGAPAKGKAVALSEVKDPTFGKEIMGKGVAVIPSEGKFYAPADGEIAMLFGTLHAVSIISDDGAEILVHIGLDTVALNGEHFKAYVAAGDKVKKGDLLIEADLDAIRAAGYDVITPVVICNTDAFAEVETLFGNEINPKDDIIVIANPKEAKRNENNYSALAEEIIEKVGGWNNIESLTHCITRLRFVLKDEGKVDDTTVAGIAGVMKVLHIGGQYQVVIGTQVADVYQAILEQKNGLGEDVPVVAEKGSKKKKSSILDILSGILMPVVSGMVAAGILKGLLIMFAMLGVMDTASDVYKVLYAASDAFFYFLPLALSITSARKFECNQFVAFAITATLVYPNLITAMGAEGGMYFLGLPITNIPYNGSVVPAIIAVWVLSKLEKMLDKVVPKLLRGMFVPLICVVIMVPLTLLLIGPVMVWLGAVVASGYTFVYNLNPAVAGMLMAALWPLLVVAGAHLASMPIAINNLATYGYDTMLPVTTGMNFAMGGAALAVALKTKDKELKEMGFTTAFSSIVGGVAEPAIYGIILRYKKPFYICMVFIGLGGLVAGIAGAGLQAYLPTCLITLPALAAFKGGWGFLAAAAIGFIGSLAGTYFLGFNDSMIEKKAN